MPTDRYVPPETIRFNVNSPAFEEKLTKLERKNVGRFNQVIELLEATRRKVEQLTWPQLYRQSSKNPKKKTGLNWERIAKQTVDGRPLNSIRLSRKARLYAFREGNEMVAYEVDLDH